MPGPAPKANKRRRNADTFTPDTVVRAEPASAPTLVGDYDERTVAWYNVWANSPQAVLFTVTDWQRLIMLAVLVERYFEAASNPAIRSTTVTQILAEIRQNEALLGATHVDRLKGRIKVERDSGPAGPSGDVAVMDDYRRMAEGL
ncbi:phage terminase small subunit [Kribbella sp. WER1]